MNHLIYITNDRTARIGLALAAVRPVAVGASWLADLEAHEVNQTFGWPCDDTDRHPGTVSTCHIYPHVRCVYATQARARRGGSHRPRHGRKYVNTSWWLGVLLPKRNGFTAGINEALVLRSRLANFASHQTWKVGWSWVVGGEGGNGQEWLILVSRHVWSGYVCYILGTCHGAEGHSSWWSGRSVISLGIRQPCARATPLLH